MSHFSFPHLQCQWIPRCQQCQGCLQEVDTPVLSALSARGQQVLTPYAMPQQNGSLLKPTCRAKSPSSVRSDQPNRKTKARGDDIATCEIQGKPLLCSMDPFYRPPPHTGRSPPCSSAALRISKHLWLLRLKSIPRTHFRCPAQARPSITRRFSCRRGNWQWARP